MMIPPKMRKDSNLILRTLLKMKSPDARKMKKMMYEIIFAFKRTIRNSLWDKSFIIGFRYKNKAKGLSNTKNSTSV